MLYSTSELGRDIENQPRDYKVTVDFDDAGRKVMFAAFAKLKKV